MLLGHNFIKRWSHGKFLSILSSLRNLTTKECDGPTKDVTATEVMTEELCRKILCGDTKEPPVIYT